MALNPKKSVAILFGTPKRLKSFSGLKSCNVAGTDIQLSDKVKILGATLDSSLTMEPHTKALSSSCFYHIRSFKQNRSSLDDGMAVSVASALVSSCLYQVNSILYGAVLKHINRLQRSRMRWQKSLPISVHTLLHSPPLHYSKTSTVYPLNREYISNWPPWHIRHCTLASHLTCPNCYNIMKPHGLRDLPLLFNSVPRYNLEFGLRAFQISAPKIWNLLPASIRNSPSLPTFRRHLKTHYFQSTNPNP